MKHIRDDEVLIHRLFRRARTLAVVGEGRVAEATVAFFHRSGYEVIPVRADRAEVQGLPSYARLSDIPGTVDLVIVDRPAEEVLPLLAEAAAVRADAVWLPPGRWSPACDEEARRHALLLVKERVPEEAYRHVSIASGHSSGLWEKARALVPSVRRRRPV